MRAAIISPTGLLGRYAKKTNYHLVLAHILWQNDKEYFDFYKRRIEAGDFVILDNSVIELGRPVDYEVLYKTCKELQPSELVLCDYPQDPRRTLEWAHTYGPKFKDEFPEMQLMVVPQWFGSKDPKNWLDSMWHLSDLDFVDTIGIPKFLSTARPKVIDALHDNRPDKQYHLLGTWGNPVEVRAYEGYNWIRGVDTKAPVRLGQYGVALHPHRGLLASMRSAVPDLDFQNSQDPLPIITEHNVKTYVGWTQGAEVIPIGEGPLR